MVRFCEHVEFQSVSNDVNGTSSIFDFWRTGKSVELKPIDYTEDAYTKRRRLRRTSRGEELRVGGLAGLAMVQTERNCSSVCRIDSNVWRKFAVARLIIQGMT